MATIALLTSGLHRCCSRRVYSQVHSKATTILSPAVRALVDINGLDPSLIRPSGPKGRILKGDVLAFLDGKRETEKSFSSDKVKSQKELRLPFAQPPIFGADGEGSGGRSVLRGSDTRVSSFEDLPLNNMRKTIAKRLSFSKSTIPHAYCTVSCNADGILEMRKRLKDNDIRVSLNDILIKLTATVLKDVPGVNVSWDSDKEETLTMDTVDISVAVATPNGLITPIIRNTNDKSITEISAELKELTLRAKDGKLKPEEYQGGSFTISNLGMFGIKQFTAIINPPQAAILAVGGLEGVPHQESGHVTTSHSITSTLCYDNRCITDETASRWLQELKRILQTPALIH